MLVRCAHISVELEQRRENMAVSKKLVRGCLLYDFNVGLSAAVLCHRIHQVFEDNSLCQRTPKNFRSRYLSHCDEVSSSSLQEMNDVTLKAAIEEDNRLTRFLMKHSHFTYTA